MALIKKPSWWEEAEPYFIYGMDALEISEDAPKELQEKFRKHQKEIEERNNI